jgi:hypothetical protein
VEMRMRLARTLLCLGYADQACSRWHEPLADARRLLPSTLAWALCFAWPGDWAMEEGMESAARMLRSAEEILGISSKHSFAYYYHVLLDDGNDRGCSQGKRHASRRPKFVHGEPPCFVGDMEIVSLRCKEFQRQERKPPPLRTMKS